MTDDSESVALRAAIADGRPQADDYEVIWRGVSIGRILKQADSPHWWWSCNVFGQPSAASDRGPAINFKDSQLRFKLAWTRIRPTLTDEAIAVALLHEQEQAAQTGAAEFGKDEEARALESNRAAPRHRVLKSGSIEFNGGTIDCVVRNVSDTGAALEVASPLGIPQAFDLVISGNRDIYRCEVKWRTESRIGVAFR
jgi:hypothetical protein